MTTIWHYRLESDKNYFKHRYILSQNIVKHLLLIFSSICFFAKFLSAKVLTYAHTLRFNIVARFVVPLKSRFFHRKCRFFADEPGDICPRSPFLVSIDWSLRGIAKKEYKCMCPRAVLQFGTSAGGSSVHGPLTYGILFGTPVFIWRWLQKFDAFLNIFTTGRRDGPFQASSVSTTRGSFVIPLQAAVIYKRMIELYSALSK